MIDSIYNFDDSRTYRECAIDSCTSIVKNHGISAVIRLTVIIQASGNSEPTGEHFLSNMFPWACAGYCCDKEEGGGGVKHNIPEAPVLSAF